MSKGEGEGTEAHRRLADEPGGEMKTTGGPAALAGSGLFCPSGHGRSRSMLQYVDAIPSAMAGVIRCNDPCGRQKL